MRFFFLFSSLSFFIFTPANAEVYKWVDENGQIHYGDKPTNQVKSETIDIKSETNTGPDPGLEKHREKQRKLLEIFEEERLEKEQKRVEDLKNDKQTLQKCAELRGYYKDLNEANVLYDLDSEGNREYLDEKSRAKEIIEIKNILKKNCN